MSGTSRLDPERLPPQRPRRHGGRPRLLREEGLRGEPRELRLDALLRAGQGRLRLLRHQRDPHRHLGRYLAAGTSERRPGSIIVRPAHHRQ